MINKKLSTFEQEMQNLEFKYQFEQEYREFLLSELLIALMEQDSKSVRALANEVGLSATIIQNIRSGKQEDIKMKNFVKLSHAFGYHLLLEKGKERIYIS